MYLFLFRSMNVFFLDPAEPDFTYTNFLDPPEPDFTYTNFFEPHRTRVYLHKLFWNPPNLILPTQTFWDHPEPDFTYTNSFGTPNRISPTLFFHIIRELFIALFFIMIIVYCLYRFCFCNIMILFISICWHRIRFISFFCCLFHEIRIMFISVSSLFLKFRMLFISFFILCYGVMLSWFSF